ncbi:response regulator [Candidatus Poribacteria bacterium]|nr:response regulator [Candidatus Poribacteria bacterium]
MENEEYTVLLVDDEEIVTTSISALLMLETDYDVLVFNSPIEALEEMQHEEIDLVISDYLMPDMNGVEFLMEMKKLQPEAIRIILTAYADKENAIKAINEVGLYQFVEKPWDNDALLLLIRNGLRNRVLLQQLREKIGELDIAADKLQQVQTEILKAFI